MIQAIIRWIAYQWDYIMDTDTVKKACDDHKAWQAEGDHLIDDLRHIYTSKTY